MKAHKQLEANTAGSQHDCDCHSDRECDHRDESDAEESDSTYRSDNTDSNSSDDEVLYATAKLKTLPVLLLLVSYMLAV